jgi:HK97 family phage prohead protease
MKLTHKLLDSTSLTLADRRMVKVVVSTSDPDRAGDVIVQSGIDLTAYRKNPVVLWGHSTDVPIARAIDIDINGGKLQATVQFPPEGDDEDSDWVYGKIKAGIVNATSIGFIPRDYEPLDSKQPWSGFKFIKSELLEFSFVSVPANAGCLIVGRSLFNGLDIPMLPSLARSNRGAPLLRSGRSISAANEELLREAMDHHASATKCVKDVLDTIAVVPDDDTGNHVPGEREPGKALAARRLLRSGRSISAANEAKLREAMDHHASATKCVKDVLDSNVVADPDEEETAALESRRRARQREARAFALIAATTRADASSSTSREQRLAEVRNLRRTMASRK